MQNATSPTPIMSFKGTIMSKYFFLLQNLHSPTCFQNKPQSDKTVLFPNYRGKPLMRGEELRTRQSGSGVCFQSPPCDALSDFSAHANIPQLNRSQNGLNTMIPTLEKITSTFQIYFSDMGIFVRDDNLYKVITYYPFYYYLASVSLVLVENRKEQDS